MTTSTLTDQASIAAFNRGPLTTVFTPSPSCLSMVTSDSLLYFGHMAENFYNSDCYPSSSSSTYTLFADFGNWNQYYFSPGQCPQGWAHATTFTSYFTNAGDNYSQLLFPLGPSTTAALCCPSGFEYFNDGHQCVSTIPPPGSNIVYVTTTLSDDTVILGAPTTTSFGSTTSILGDGVPVWWQSSDLAAFTATPSTTNPSASSSSLTVTASASATSTPGSGGLTLGGKIVIGILVPVGCIAIIIGILALFRRHNIARRRQEQRVYVGERYEALMRPELGTDGAVSELDSRLLSTQYELAGPPSPRG